MGFINKIKAGSFSELFRFQDDFKGLFFLVFLLIVAGVSTFILYNNYILMIFWILIIVVCVFLFIIKAKILLIYPDYFICMNIFDTKRKCQEKLTYNKMVSSYVHIASARGQNNFTFTYILDGEEKKAKFGFANASKKIQCYKFLHSKGITIYIDSKEFAASVFEVPLNKILSQERYFTTWYHVKSQPDAPGSS